MEFADFDDTLFETNEKSSSKKLKEPQKISYNAKFCENRWFEGEFPIEPGEAAHCAKSRGDLAFLQQRYEAACSAYRQALDVLPATHTLVKKDIAESLCRSCAAVGQHEEALDLAHMLMREAVNFEQKSSSLFLLADVYREARRIREEIMSLACALEMHPSVPTPWERLAELYPKLPASTASQQHEQISNSTQKEMLINRFHSSTLTDLETVIMTTSNDAKIMNDTDHEKAGSSMRQNNHIITDGVSMSRPVAKQEVTMVSPVVTGMPTSCVVGTCLIRARILRRHMLRGESDFVKAKNEQKIIKLTEAIDSLSLPPQFFTKCYNIGREEEEDDSDSKEEVTMTTRQFKWPDELSLADFEKKWFEWR